ncbi:MAG: biotin--[acetyl-CoA-carboxylase] ligase [Thermonemataceae bacterium]|nr:biotin--[acetyl-CoA-carboxylase] ligase [Thermonemataceae bacterium]
MQKYENFSKKIKTLFIGKDLQYLPSCQSTNTYAFELIQNEDYFDGTVVLTDEQTAGRGQAGNTWEAEAGQNITMSLILCPKFLTVQEQFFLNMAITLAIHDFLLAFVPEKQVLQIKWSNDLLYLKKKIAGVLIQNIISQGYISKSVIGIGININQRSFIFEGATSLNILTGLMYDLEFLVAKLLEKIEARYWKLKERKFEELRQDYYQNLYAWQEYSPFESENEVWWGKILGVDEWGMLLIERNGISHKFNFKEIKFLLGSV